MKDLGDLLLFWQDGSMSDDERAEFKRRLARPEGRRLLVDDFFMSAVIVDTLAKEKEEGKRGARTPSRGRARRVRLVRRPRALPLGAWTAAAAALVLLGVGYALYAPRTPPEQPVAVAQEDGQEDGQKEEIVPARPEPVAHVVAVSAEARAPRARAEVVRLEAGAERRLALARGEGLLPGDRIETGAGGVTFRYAGEATVVELGEGTALRLDLVSGAKRIDLERGTVSADVAKQPRGKAMVIVTPHAEAEVLGTRLKLLAGPHSTRLEVAEGRARLTRKADGASVVVSAGEYAVTGEGLALVARRVGGVTVTREEAPESAPSPPRPSAPRVDFAAASWTGDGVWTERGGVWTQSRVSRQAGGATPAPTSNILFPLRDEPGQVVIESKVTVAGVTPDLRRGAGAWGFGLLVGFSGRTFVFRTIRNTRATQPGIEIKAVDQKFLPIAHRRLDHGREGTYRVKLKVSRRQGGNAFLQGKLWQGESEPAEWMIETELERAGGLDSVGLTTTRCACVFEEFGVQATDR